MGVKGLSPFLYNREEAFFDKVRLKDCKVVVDGNVLRWFLVWWSLSHIGCPGIASTSAALISTRASEETMTSMQGEEDRKMVLLHSVILWVQVHQEVLPATFGQQHRPNCGLWWRVKRWEIILWMQFWEAIWYLYVCTNLLLSRHAKNNKKLTTTVSRLNAMTRQSVDCNAENQV